MSFQHCEDTMAMTFTLFRFKAHNMVTSLDWPFTRYQIRLVTYDILGHVDYHKSKSHARIKTIQFDIVTVRNPVPCLFEVFVGSRVSDLNSYRLGML